MRFTAETLDDLLRKLYPKLLSASPTTASRGNTREQMGAVLEIKRPRARLSRTETRGKPFSCLGELLWYLSRSNSLDFITYYIKEYADESEDGEIVHGGYGPRLFNQRGHDQVRNVINTLRENEGSRRAVIQLFNAEDISRRFKEIPCTCTLQFMVRRGHLHLLVSMRSNDAYKGLPHDVFCFTMLQEIIARTIGKKLGTYIHFASSLHLYEDDLEATQQYLDEGVQSTILMPPMPEGDPWPSLQRILEAERIIRLQNDLNANDWGVAPYWADLIRLLQIFAATGNSAKIDELKAEMAFTRYTPYIDKRKGMRPRDTTPPQQLTLPI